MEMRESARLLFKLNLTMLTLVHCVIWPVPILNMVMLVGRPCLAVLKTRLKGQLRMRMMRAISSHDQ